MGSSVNPNSKAVLRLTASTWLVLVVGVLAAGAIVADGLIQMLGWLLNRPEYSHGPVIPFVSAFLIWQRRDKIERVPLSGSWIGVVVVVAGVSLGLLGRMSSVFTLQDYAFFLMLYGLVFSLTGPRAFRLIAAPLLILLLMVPLPEFLYQNISSDLQLFSSRLGVWFMRLFGVTVFLEGNVIDLGAYKLQVAEACDGLRYLFPLMTLGFLIAYFFKASFWKRALLFLSSVPITVLMNSLRVGTIGVMVEHWGVRMATGFLHEFQGWVVFMIASALMFLEMLALAEVGESRISWRHRFGLEFPASLPVSSTGVPRMTPASTYICAGLLVAVAVFAAAAPPPKEFVPQRESFAQFPSSLGNWQATREALDTAYLDTLKLDDYYLGNFRSEAKGPINLYVAWYNSQRAGHSTHSPRSCLPGGGWRVESLTEIKLPEILVAGSPLLVNRVIIQMGTDRQLVYYWFQQRGRVVTNEYAAKWYLFEDSLIRNRSDGALVRLVAPLPLNMPIGEADLELREFTALAVHAIAPFVPN